MSTIKRLVAMSVLVAVWGENQNLQGSKDAAPIFTEISNWLLNYLEVKPTN